jgi:NADPH:quinone reductase-like Zn-dependent oxidoreductase
LVQNTALWLPRRGAELQVGPAPYTAPGPGEVGVRVGAVAINPVDAMPGIAYRVVLPWLTFPAVIGSDVAGEVVEVGPGVTRFRPGDRVVGMAIGLERDRDRAAEGAFQHYVVLLGDLVSPIPDELSYEQAAVLPLALSTAATGLFQADHLGLQLPRAHAADRDETVLVWGGSTSVGSNAIQLARGAGYRVVTTASPRNFDYVRSLGAAAAVDYRDRDAINQVIAAIGAGPLAGALAIGAASLPKCWTIATRLPGPRRVAAAQPALATRIQMLGRRPRGVQVSAIWGGTLRHNEVGPSIYADYLPSALAENTYRPAPRAVVVGKGLEQIPTALDRIRRGVSASKLVVQL